MFVFGFSQIRKKQKVILKREHHLALNTFCAKTVTDKLGINQKLKTKQTYFFMHIEQVYLMKNKQTRTQKAYFITIV